jgi:hypothetical protein
MSDKKLVHSIDKELSTWFSTYGLITVERILERYGITINHDDIGDILNDTSSIHYQLLRVPLNNILNNIILNQAEDYREYCQKLFIDYLLSGAGNESNAPAQGAAARESLEEDRLRLVSIGESYDIEVFNHHS